jgi:hypothetical protein
MGFWCLIFHWVYWCQQTGGHPTLICSLFLTFLSPRPLQLSVCSKALFLIQVFLGCKFCPSLLETVGLRDITWYTREFSMFSVRFSSKNCPSTRCASDANIVCWQKKIAHFMVLSCLVYSSTLKMETIYSSERSVYFRPTTRLYVPGHRTLHSHGYGNLTPNNLTAMFITVCCFLPHSPHANIKSPYCKQNVVMFILLIFIVLLCHQ